MEKKPDVMPSYAQMKYAQGVEDGISAERERLRGVLEKKIDYHVYDAVGNNPSLNSGIISGLRFALDALKEELG